MGIDSLVANNHYSQTMMERMNAPLHQGEITPQEALEWGTKLIVAPRGAGAIRLYMAIEEANDTIKVAKFQCYGTPVMIASSDVAVELCLGKSVDEVLGLTIERIEKALRDSDDTPAFPSRKLSEVQTMQEVIYEAIATYKGVEVASLEIPKATQTPQQKEDTFRDLTIVGKVKAVDRVIDEHIRAMLVADGGNMEILDIKENGPHIDIYIRYLGACSGCASANTGTLFAIEATLKKELDEHIRVLPI
ncbi:MAG: hypothetical protein KU38_07400 [Sulfurovum sp. FS08-3]|nr:MAG: hypothetical protein KU38_07400 [Sulfurovum sp. FS08-3]